jgi:hypothetical protein
MQNKGTEPVRLIVFQVADPSKPLHEAAVEFGPDPTSVRSRRAIIR